jgi:hypothetical protein
MKLGFSDKFAKGNQLSNLKNIIYLSKSNDVLVSSVMEMGASTGKIYLLPINNHPILI